MGFANLLTDLQAKQLTNKVNNFKHVKQNRPKLLIVPFVRTVDRFTQRINSICTDITDKIDGRKQKTQGNSKL